MKRKIIIGTRGSKLALAQAGWFMRQLKKKAPDVHFDIRVIKTKGDKIKDVPFAPPGAGGAGFDSKGIFTKEIDDALLRGDIDIAVHSMKDVPTDIPKGLEITAVTKRENPADCLVSKKKGGLKGLKKGSRIGTSSLRRKAQILNLRKDLAVSDLRGNLDTRFRKLESGAFDGIIVAAAGLKRLGKKVCVPIFISLFSYDDMLPACGQGALGIMAREDDEIACRLLDALNDTKSYSAVSAERAFLKGLGGGCQIPIGALAEIHGNRISLRGGVFSLDGSRSVKGRISGNKKDACKLGMNLAKKLLSKGAGSIIKGAK